MRPFRVLKDDRRRIYLALVGSVESKLRDAYGKLNDAGLATQASVAAKLGIGRSTVHRRLNGGESMTLQSVADMVWAMGYCIEVDIFDPADRSNRNDLVSVRHRPMPEASFAMIGGTDSAQWGEFRSTPIVQVTGDARLAAH